METGKNIHTSNIYKCDNCGGNLKYNPGTTQNICESCNNTYDIALNSIDILFDEINKFDQNKNIDDLKTEIQIITCLNCGAEILFDSNVVSGECSFCTTPLNITQTSLNRKMKPEAILPFQIDHKLALKKYYDWFHSRWFAPNDLIKKSENPDKLSGIYIPFWIFNANSYSKYKGYKIVKRNKSTSRYFKEGEILQNFHHLDIVASSALPKKNIDLLEPWNWDKMVNYDEKLVLGFKSESYTVDLKTGEKHAEEKMTDIIKQLVKKEIGGDRQDITFLETEYSDVKYKHVLLPIWLSTFRYKDKTYRFVINGESGEVQGERPYSIWKTLVYILCFVIAIVPMFYFWINGPALYRIIFMVAGIVQIIILGKIGMKAYDIPAFKKINPYLKK